MQRELLTCFCLPVRLCVWLWYITPPPLYKFELLPAFREKASHIHRDVQRHLNVVYSHMIDAASLCIVIRDP